MKPGSSTWLLIVALCALTAFAIYRQSSSSAPRSGDVTDIAIPGNDTSRRSSGTSPATTPDRSAAATAAEINSSASRTEAPRLSLQEIEKMRKLAIAHNTPASQYIREMFDAKSPRADIAAAVLHGDLSKGRPDPAWSTASEMALRSEIAQLPSNFSSRLEFSQVNCGPSLCELQAATRYTSPYQSSQDVHDWQVFVRQMLRSSALQADQLTNPVVILSMTPDDRPLFLVYFRRGQNGGSDHGH